MTKSKKAKASRPFPRIAYRPSAAPPPPAKDSPWGEFRINPDLEKHNSTSKNN